MSSKPKKRGIILDSLALTGKNIWGIIKIVLVFYIFLSLVSAGIVFGGTALANKYKDILPYVSIISVVGIAIFGGLVQSFTDASAIKYIHERRHGNKITARKAIGAAFKKFWRIIGAEIIIAIISGIAGFIATISYTLIALYVGSDGSVFGILLGGVIGAVAMILTSFIIPAIIIEDKKVFAAFKESMGLLVTNDGQVILKTLGLLVVSFIAIAVVYLLKLIPGVELIMTYVVILISQVILVFMEVGKVIIFEDYK